MLIVDDDEVLRQQIISILASQNIKVQEAINGVDAIQKYINKQNANTCCVDFESIIIDINIPIINGWETALQLRQLGFQGYIIGYTGYSMQQDVEKAQEYGMSCVLTKPVSIEKLINAAKGYLTDIMLF